MNHTHQSMRRPMLNRQSVLDRARQDTRPDLVAINLGEIDATLWPHVPPMTIDIDGPPGTTPQSALPFLVAMSAINYRFWSLGPDGTLDRYEHLGKSGARALWRAFEQAWGETAKDFGARLSSEPFGSIFGAIPDAPMRQVLLREVLAGDRLDAICDDIIQDVEERGAVTAGHAGMLADAFPVAFGDPYMKKAQLAVSIYAGYLRSLGRPVDTAGLTAMADYQVPRVLRALGILTYAQALATTIAERRLVAPGSSEENAIRAATVIACEAIADHLGVTATDVDNLLWMSQGRANGAPFHLTLTTRY